MNQSEIRTSKIMDEDNDKTWGTGMSEAEAKCWNKGYEWGRDEVRATYKPDDILSAGKVAKLYKVMPMTV